MASNQLDLKGKSYHQLNSKLRSINFCCFINNNKPTQFSDTANDFEWTKTIKDYKKLIAI